MEAWTSWFEHVPYRVNRNCRRSAARRHLVRAWMNVPRPAWRVTGRKRFSRRFVYQILLRLDFEHPFVRILAHFILNRLQRIQKAPRPLTSLSAIDDQTLAPESKLPDRRNSTCGSRAPHFAEGSVCCGFYDFVNGDWPLAHR